MSFEKNNLLFPIQMQVSQQEINLVLEDNSYLFLENYQRPLEYNILSSYGYETDRPIFFFSGLQTNQQNCGRGSFLMNCASIILDENNYWVLNELRPTPFNDEQLGWLIEFYQRFQFELLERGRDAALMLRKPTPGQHLPSRINIISQTTQASAQVRQVTA